MNPLDLTHAEIIARQYSAAMDSVNLVNGLLNKPYKSQEDIDSIERNAGHLRLMLQKDFWTTEDLTPIQAVVNAVEAETLVSSVDPNAVTLPVNIVLPNHAKFHELISGTEVWSHVFQHCPIEALGIQGEMVGSASLNKQVVTENIKNLMKLAIIRLGTDHALHSTPSSKMVTNPNDPEGLPIPVGTLADELDSILIASFFPFTYAELSGI